jgi:tRNA A37 threonylcarbamoyltransferase TsaD/tRNA A37 threonylcarbamoyladenosine biosynthesis protein TsaE
MYCFLYIKIEFLVILLVITYSWLKVTQQPCNPAMIAWLYKTVTNERGGKTTKLCYVKHYRLQQPCRNIVVFPSIMQPDVSQPEAPPEPINITVPYTSSSIEDTSALAREVVMRIRGLWEDGKRVMVLLNAPKGGGKSAFVTQIMDLLSHTNENFGSISFQRVAQYTIIHDGCIRHILHMDPNLGGPRHIHTLHDPMSKYDLVLMEHGDDCAYDWHRTQLKTLPNFVEVKIDIAVDEHVETTRVFTITSTGLVPAPSSLPHTWTGSLFKMEYSPDTRIPRDVMEKLITLAQKGELCIIAYETSCDDTCAAIYVDGKEQWRQTTRIEQKDQEVGKGGVDPLQTANEHKNALVILQQEMDQILLQNNLTAHYVAVTKGPGLALTLVQGIYHAQKIAFERSIPIFHADHIMGHGITPMKSNPDLKYPYVCQIVSGGHTVTMCVKSATDMEKVCFSQSDAWGEVIDKIARALGIPDVPAGRAMEILMNKFMTTKVWSDVLQMKEYRQILMEVYGKESLTASLDPSHVKLVLNRLVEQHKRSGYDKKQLLLEFIREFYPDIAKKDEVVAKDDVVAKNEVRTREEAVAKANAQHKKEIIAMVNSVKFTELRATDIIQSLSAPAEPALYQHWVDRYKKYLQTKENKNPIFNDFVKLCITETILPEPVQSLYSAVQHTVIANSLIADAMVAHVKYPSVKHYSITGGVGGNDYIATAIKNALAKMEITFRRVAPIDCSDNGAMIAELAWRVFIETMYSYPIIDEFINKLFELGAGMITEMPTIEEVEHNARKRWSGPTCI